MNTKTEKCKQIVMFFLLLKSVLILVDWVYRLGISILLIMIIRLLCTMDRYFMYLMLVFAVQKTRFSGTALQAQNLVLVSKYLSNIFSRQVDELLVYKY